MVVDLEMDILAIVTKHTYDEGGIPRNFQVGDITEGYKYISYHIRFRVPTLKLKKNIPALLRKANDGLFLKFINSVFGH